MLPQRKRNEKCDKFIHSAWMKQVSYPLCSILSKVVHLAFVYVTVVITHTLFSLVIYLVTAKLGIYFQLSGVLYYIYIKYQ